MSPLNVLILAESANPAMVSGALIGWSHARAIARLTTSHLVTQVRNKAAIEKEGWQEGVDYTAIDTERVARPAWRLANILPGGWTTRTAITALTYSTFERRVWARFKDDLMAGRWDVVHRITPVSPTVPSPIASKLSAIGVPFVIGPLNGGVEWPSQFQDRRRAEREWLSYARVAHQVLPGYRSTRQSAAAIICGSRATLAQMPEWCRAKCHYMPENGIDPDRFARFAALRHGGPLRVAFVGRLVPYKCPDVLIEAAAPLIAEGKVVVDVIGDGPMMPALKRQVECSGVSDGVRLAGWVRHEELQVRLSESEVLGFPSIREFGGAVVLEAMALGLVPLVVDYAGPGELVCPSFGIAVPMSSRSELVENLREAMVRLYADRNQVHVMSRAAQNAVRTQHTWAARAAQSLNIYQQVISSVTTSSARREGGTRR